MGSDPFGIIFCGIGHRPLEKFVNSLGNNLFPTIMEYQKNEFDEPVKKDKTEIAAKILLGLGAVVGLAILGFIIWCGYHVFSGWESF